MTRAVTILLILIVAACDNAVRVNAQESVTSDDRAVLEVVIAEVSKRAGWPALHAGRSQGSPIVVVQGARPMCRQKVREADFLWPVMCGPQREDLENTLNGRAGLAETERLDLVRSFQERNVQWQDLPDLKSKNVAWLPRQAFIDGASPMDLTVLSLPGYSRRGHAVVFATFSCGNVCGTDWYAILRRVNDVWEVQDFLSTGIA